MSLVPLRIVHADTSLLVPEDGAVMAEQAQDALGDLVAVVRIKFRAGPERVGNDGAWHPIGMASQKCDDAMY